MSFYKNPLFSSTCIFSLSLNLAECSQFDLFMKSGIHHFSLLRNIDSIIAAAIGFFIIHIFTRHSGIGISPDSVEYLSVARNFHDGRGLTSFDQMPLVDFPSFYPLFLWAVMSMTHSDPLSFAPVLNGLLFAILIYTSGSLMNGFAFRSKWYKRIMLACFLFSPCLLEVYSMVWSETLFLLFFLFYMPSVRSYLETHSINRLLVMALIAGLACVTRYAGISFLLTGGVIILMDPRLRKIRKLAHLTIFSLVTISFLAINLARNFAVGGYLTGQRQRGVTPLHKNIYYYGTVLSEWMPVFKKNYSIALITGIACLILIAVIFIRWVVKRFDTYSYELTPIIFTLTYSLFMILSATYSRFQQLDSRLLSPLFIPLLWTLSFWMAPLVAKLQGLKKKLAIALCILLLFSFQYNQLMTDYETYDGVKDAGIPGYTEDPWPSSPLVNFIKKNPGIFLPGYARYSNAGDAVYFFTGLSCELLPQKVFPQEVRTFYAEDDLYLIWFKEIINPDLLSLEDILQHKKMDIIRRFPDGTIYLCKKISGQDSINYKGLTQILR